MKQNWENSRKTLYPGKEKIIGSSPNNLRAKELVYSKCEVIPGAGFQKKFDQLIWR
jgi:hypothetical protein